MSLDQDLKLVAAGMLASIYKDNFEKIFTEMSAISKELMQTMTQSGIEFDKHDIHECVIDSIATALKLVIKDIAKE